MKRILTFIFGAVFFLTEQSARAQMLDDLFDEEELRTPADDVAANPKEIPVEKNIVAADKNVAVAPAAEKKVTPPPAAREEAPKTFSLPSARKNIDNGPSIPLLGNGKQESMPNLGKKKKEEERLSLFEMRARKTQSHDVNVMNFDIAGIRLGMTPDEVTEHAQEAGFSLKFKNTEIPEFNKWKYHRECLQNMFFSYKVKQECIRETARMNNSEYVRQLVFENKTLRETLNVDFTSNYTENQAYRIHYVSKGDHSLGTTDEAYYLKERRRAEFLEMLIRKYGQPEDEQALLWGIAGFGAIMQADISETFQDASLVLEDLNFEEDDYKAFADEDAKSEPLGKFSF